MQNLLKSMERPIYLSSGQLCDAYVEVILPDSFWASTDPSNHDSWSGVCLSINSASQGNGHIMYRANVKS